ncbi:MAG: Asp-tRNA(Asn)/Glu-tRNA(Gln) amidotransferase subunit GatB [Clostridia bacterium]|nr:Asp-tRNA(Asn)/Glu-tRNA(Gln) amidotransferase subunit GatB [Clostridia bacterium]MBN2882672.1 Asp-tRNA(Asn)/Glu-tRNA(Gln) amidotransferase subunit GatB [Clostridia bacterium]
MDYEIVIGLEIHVELSTKSKMFCGCTTEFGGDINTHCCPVCTSMPGTLPVMNKKAVEYAAKAGLAMNCSIANYSKMDRKNYFYPDLPKAYQISQFDLPICKRGYVDIETEGISKRIGITRIHMEEDAGKLLHDQWGKGTLVDYNRCGVPLIEIVSEPDMRSPQEAKDFAEKVRSILQYVGVSDCKMQEGSLRADVNLSVRPTGSSVLGTRTEMKNLNSFRSILRAAESEAKRQIDLIESGGIVVQETRRWDDDAGKSYSMRSKEEAHDYRYFPEPDLVPIELSDSIIEEYKKSLPEMPWDRFRRYTEELGIPGYDASLITVSVKTADFFDRAVESGADPKTASNWIMGDLMKLMKEIDTEEIPFDGSGLSELIALIEKGIISNNIGKTVFEEMFRTGKAAGDIVREKGLEIVSDESALEEIVEKVIDENPKSVADFLAGKEKAVGFIMGQVMKETKGKANPQMINGIIRKKLEALKNM